MPMRTTTTDGITAQHTASQTGMAEGELHLDCSNNSQPATVTFTDTANTAGRVLAVAHKRTS